MNSSSRTSAFQLHYPSHFSAASDDFSNRTVEVLAPIWTSPFNAVLVATVLYLGWSLVLRPKRGNELLDLPVIGSRFSMIARWQFFRNAWPMILEGYEKVRNCS